MPVRTTAADRLEALRIRLLHAGADLSPAGVPGTPLVVVELDELAVTPPTTIAAAAALLRESLPLTVGILRRPLTPRPEPLLDACTLTLTGESAQHLPRGIVAVPDLDAALRQLADAVAHAPQAAIACGQLLRRTGTPSAHRPEAPAYFGGTGTASVLPTRAMSGSAAEVPGSTTSALAAEAAVYSMLLGGNEFARWLAERPAPRPVPDTGDVVRMYRHGSRLSIVLDHPVRRNALSVRLREELLTALTVADSDPTIDAVELTGTGPSFCSGGDLAEFGIATDPVAAYLVRLDRAPWRLLDRLADRLTVHLRGACIGAGAEMSAFAGHVTATPDTWFRFPEVAMGLIPGAGGTVSIPRRIGRWRAAWLMLTGLPLSAQEALRWGLVDELVDARPDTGTVSPAPDRAPDRNRPEHR